MNINDLDIPWFVVEEADKKFPDTIWHRICYQSDFGPAEIAALQVYANTRHRRRMAYLMAAAPAMYEALQELFQLLQENKPPWYLRRYHELAVHALASAEPPEEDGAVT